MNKRWTSAKTIQFLEAYERNSCLWDVYSPDYKNKEKREKAYENLSSVMNIEGFDVDAVRAKIRSIRNAYALERCKIISSKNKNTDEVYESKLVRFPLADRILRKVFHSTGIKVVCIVILYCSCVINSVYVTIV